MVMSSFFALLPWMERDWQRMSWNSSRSYTAQVLQKFCHHSLRFPPFFWLLPPYLGNEYEVVVHQESWASEQVLFHASPMLAFLLVFFILLPCKLLQINTHPHTFLPPHSEQNMWKWFSGCCRNSCGLRRWEM